MIKKIYIYLISFATLMMVIGGSIATFSAIADLVAPNNYYMTYDDYTQSNGKEEGNSTVQSKDELQKKYDNYLKNEKEMQKQRSLNQLIQSFAWVFIPLPIFIYMQRFLRRDKEEEKEETKEDGK